MKKYYISILLLFSFFLADVNGYHSHAHHSRRSCSRAKSSPKPSLSDSSLSPALAGVITSSRFIKNKDEESKKKGK